MGKNTKEKILEAAFHELELSGPSFRMDDLARRLNISKRTLYENFSSKEEIIDKVIEALQDELYQQHLELLQDTRLTADEKLLAFFAMRIRSASRLPKHAIYDLLKKMPSLNASVCERSMRDWKLLEAFVDEAQQNNLFVNFDKKLFMYMLSGISKEIFNNFDDLDEYYAYPEAMEPCIRMLLNGIKKNGGTPPDENQS